MADEVERLELVVVLQIAGGADGSERRANSPRQAVIGWRWPQAGQFLGERLSLLFDDRSNVLLGFWRELIDVLKGTL